MAKRKKKRKSKKRLVRYVRRAPSRPSIVNIVGGMRRPKTPEEIAARQTQLRTLVDTVLRERGLIT